MINRDTGRQLAGEVREADTFTKRLRGLMFEESLPQGCALHIRPCRSVHTWFMRFPIDVLFLDADRKVVGLEENVPPGRWAVGCKEAASVVELPAGSIRETGTTPGQAVFFQEARSASMI